MMERSELIEIISAIVVNYRPPFDYSLTEHIVRGSERYHLLAGDWPQLRDITKLESGGIYAIAVPHTTSPNRATDYRNWLKSQVDHHGLDVKFIVIPTVGESARLDELEAELARVKEFVGGPS